MTMPPEQKRKLKSQAHHLNPVVTVGSNGLAESVLAEVEAALLAHELIKIKIHSQDRDERKKIGEEILTKTNSTLIQSIGHVIAIYRKNQDK